MGQLLLAIALSLAIGQMVNLALIANGRQQNRLAQLAGPAATRIGDAVDRINFGMPLPAPPPALPGRPPRIPQIVQSPQTQVAADMARWPELDARIQNLLLQNGVSVLQVQAGTGRLQYFGNDGPGDIVQPVPKRPARRQQLVVSAEISAGNWISVRGRIRRDDPGMTAYLIAQTLLLYIFMIAPMVWIVWRATKPLRLLKIAASAPLPPDGGDPVPLSGPADVRELTAAFNAMRTRLADILAQKDRMLGAIGHDLRTPLASLRVRSEQVADPVLGAKMAHTVDEMANILNDILDLARIGQSREPRTMTDISALIEAVVADYGDDPAHNKTVIYEHENGAARSIVPVRGLLLRRAVRNLIDNGLSHGGGQVRIALARDDKAVGIAISDSGPGIPADRIADMLEPFARSEYSRNSAHGGAGLGLALVKAIIEGEGGRLTLANAATGGLVATLWLPSPAS